MVFALQLDVKEFAEQLTLLHGELFYHIAPDEFINKVWKKANHGTGVENLDRMIDAFNQVFYSKKKKKKS